MISAEEREAIPQYRQEAPKIPRFLVWTYILLPIWGICWFYFFWNGSDKEQDHAKWHDLQVAAKTTYQEE